MNVENSITKFVTSITNWLDKNIQVIAMVILIFAIAVIANRIISDIFGRLLARTIREDMFPSKTDRDRRYRTLNSIATAIISFLVWTIAVIMILNALGVNTAPLLASAGIVGVALGFGAQSLVKDFMSGMFIIAENQYRVGDYVEIQNVKGVVESVSIRTTIVKDDDGNIYHIPNGSIVVTSNRSMSNNKIGINLSVTPDSDIDKLKTIIDKVGIKQSKDQSMGDLIISPLHFERVQDISSGSITVRISGRVKPGKRAEIKSDFYLNIQKELIRNKISLK